MEMRPKIETEYGGKTHRYLAQPSPASLFSLSLRSLLFILRDFTFRGFLAMVSFGGVLSPKEGKLQLRVQIW
jgi:hypothetical protein